MLKNTLQINIMGNSAQVIEKHYDECGIDRRLMSEHSLDYHDVRFYFDFGATRVYYSPDMLWSMIERKRVASENARMHRSDNLEKEILKKLVKDAVIELVEAVFK